MQNLILPGVLLISAAVAMIIQNWFLRNISVNYIALVVGIIVAILLGSRTYFVDTELFMGLITAPLLFFEGQNNRLASIAKSWKSIIGITVVMILIATITAAFSLKWIMGLSLSFAFILAALSTPTDATATESVIHGLKMPKKVSQYLRNESLFNDASGIILIDMAVSWYVSQKLKVDVAIEHFLYSVIGGILVGLVLTAILILIRQSMLRSNLNFSNNNNLETTTSLLIVYLLTPSVIYFIAESIHVSGIIAVVVSGLMHNAELERSKLTNLQLTYTITQSKDIMTEILNAIVFVGLGISLVMVYHENLIPNNIDEAIYIGIILYVVNVLIRYIYGLLVLRLVNKESWEFALGGIHGGVTFALAYMLDHTLISSSNFHTIIFSVATLILLSMLVPRFLFRFMLPKEITDEEKNLEIKKIKEKMVKYALTELKKLYLPKKLRKQLEFDLQAQIDETSMHDFVKELRKSIKQPEMPSDEREFRDEIYRYAFRLERNYLGEIAQQTEQYRDEFLSLYRGILLAEILFLHSDED